MSSEPLLPSYASATGRTQHHNRYYQSTSNRNHRNHYINPAIAVIETLCALTFSGTALILTGWAYQSYKFPELTPPASAPLLPYFASLCLIVSLGCWFGYLVFISYDETGGPRTQRKIVIWVSIVGKLVFAGAHTGFWLAYKYISPGSTEPNWLLMFLAVQAWWDFLLLVVYSCLRVRVESVAR